MCRYGEVIFTGIFSQLVLPTSIHQLTGDNRCQNPDGALNTKKGGKSCSGYLWAYVSGERTGPSVVCFDCRTGRSHEYPENWLQGWGGTLVVDGHKAYRTLANKVPEITLAGCWAHARRGFADLYKISKDPRAAIAVKKIAGLYRLEKKISVSASFKPSFASLSCFRY